MKKSELKEVLKALDGVMTDVGEMKDNEEEALGDLSDPEGDKAIAMQEVIDQLDEAYNSLDAAKDTLTGILTE